jgi:hypothetical protein
MVSFTSRKSEQVTAQIYVQEFAARRARHSLKGLRPRALSVAKILASVMRV